jgi:hypothetical protein
MKRISFRRYWSGAVTGSLFAGAVGFLSVHAGLTQPDAAAPAAPPAKPARAQRSLPVPSIDPAKLAPIVGDANGWKLVEKKPGSTQVREVDGKTVLLSEDLTSTLTSQAALDADSEISVRFRILAQEKINASINLQTAIADPENARDLGLVFSVSNKGQPTTVIWSATNVNTSPGQKKAKNGIYNTGFTATSSLGWPDDVRRRVEADMAAAEQVSEHWFTMSVALRKDTVEFFIDGIPVSKAERKDKADLKTSGFARLVISPNIQVTQLSVRKLGEENPSAIYQPVNLYPVLNSDSINGKKLSFPASNGEPVKIGAVPFEIAPANDRGQNHVDVGASWLRQGNLEGRFSGDRDALGGRWPSALERDPARIVLRVPNGRYRALHLLAVTDNDPDSVPIVTAQFFRQGAGFPESFVSPTVPKMGAGGATATAVKFDGSANATLHHIVIPLDPGALYAFADQQYLEMELTKQVQNYRAYPDPLFYSVHAAGLPSGVHIFAATLERPTVDVELIANAYGHVWTAPLKPEYSITIQNRAGAARPVDVTLTTKSYFDNKTTEQKQTLRLGTAGQEATASFKIDPPCYGYHDVQFTVKDGEQTLVENRSLAYLHEETRERGEWDFGKGPMFGFWNWAGGHGTPSGPKQILVMGQAGAETMHSGFEKGDYGEEGLRIAERYKIKSYKFAGPGDHYVTGRFAGDLSTSGLDVARQNFLKTLNERKAPSDAYNRPLFLAYYAEPSVGFHTLVPPADYYNAPPLPFSPAEEERYRFFFNGIVEGTKIVKQNFPYVKNMLPHGDPLFPVPFLRRNPEIAKMIDGVSVDIPAFERLPEQQIHQIAIHRMYVSNKEFAKAGLSKPLYAVYEGPCLPTGPGALTQRELSDLSVRNSLMLLGYGADFQTGGFPGFDCTSPWGEQHYGYGVFYSIPWEMPKPAFAAFATMTRMLNRSNFDGWTPTGSLSTYAMRFKHYKTGKIVHVLWTIRGTREVNIPVPAGSFLAVTDAMDNTVTRTPQNGQVSFTINSSPVYVTGLPAEVKITLGEADNSDAQPAAIKTKLANFGDGSWKLSDERDESYEKAHYPHIVRFPGKMSIAPAEAPSTQGGKALSVHLDKQDVERVFMPYYSTLTPAKPIVIPGKASHLGVWVRASSDWGRVLYSLRDAKGERWISIGKAGAWNCDDLHSWSYFNFDGWRYLRFELPANAPYDSFREAGSTWWGSYSSGDNNIDLPLSLEKVIVERRTHAMYVNDPQPAKNDDVLLGDLFAEYSSPQDQGLEAVRLASLRMPIPTGAPELDNPIEKMARTNAGAPTSITEIKLPEQASDGTQCYVFFEKRPDAVAYDVWASPYPDGRGALQLAKNWKEPGGLVRGFRPDTDFYLFVTYTDKDGKVSKPSAPFKIHLLDLFAQK